MNELEADVVVAGGGIAGLGLACALAAWDVSVLVLEKRSKAGGIHRGDSLLPRTTALFARWGVLDAVRAADAQPISRIEIHHGARKLCETPLAGASAETPYLVLPHARIEQVLLERALAFGRARLVRPARVTDVVREGGRVTGVRFETPEGPGVARGRLVVACDGHRSIVRSRLGIEVAPLYYDHLYLGLEADRPASYENAMRVHFHPEGGVLLMPRPTRVGIGMLVPAHDRGRWARLSDERLRAEVVARAPILREAAIHREGANVYELVRAHAPRYVKEGAVIVGDAAHATNPTAGQGMTMALGDVGLLSDLVGPALAGTDRDLDEALAAYERQRWPANEATVRGSHLLAQIYALRGGAWNRVKCAGARLLASPLGRLVVNPILESFIEDRSPKRPRPAIPPVVSVARASRPCAAGGRDAHPTHQEDEFDEAYEEAVA
jgi:2-polyprenyl-6-methoxyphenol hydroxylase-like FAD-dependent oxidoreductase